jgi:hypothetical protein
LTDIAVEKQSDKYKEFKDWTFLRDKHQCKECTSDDQIRLHHEDKSLSMLYEPSNVVTLCKTCHLAKQSSLGGKGGPGRGFRRFLVITVKVMAEESGLCHETVRRHIKDKKVDPWNFGSIRRWLNRMEA